MKKRKSIALMLIMLILTAALAGCGNAVEDDAADTAVTITDMAGREITFDAPVERIVVLTPSDCEILYAVGAGDAVVGRGTYCDYPAEALDKPEVAAGADTNIEEIIALEPQVVLMNTMTQTEEQVAALEEAGIKVVVSNANDIAGVYTAIEMIGRMMGKDNEAQAVIDGMKKTFADVQSKAGGSSGQTVYFEVSPLEWGLWTAGSGTFMDEIAAMLGLTNIFADVEGWGEISEEQVIERNPDIIVTITMYFGEGPTPEQEIADRAGWQGIAAISNGAVFNADSNEISRPGPRLADAALALCEFVYVTMAADYAA